MRCLLASEAFALTVEIDPKRRLLREPRRGCVGQGWRQRTSALNEMNAPACVDPGMCNGTCRATTSTHAKDSTTVRTTTGQTSHGHHASPVRAGGANLIPLEPEGVHAQQGMGIVDAVPISDEMLQRGGEAQPSPFLGMKRRGARQSVDVGFGQDAFARHHANRPAQEAVQSSARTRLPWWLPRCARPANAPMRSLRHRLPQASRPSEERAGERLRPPRDGPPPRAPAEPRVGQHGERLEAVGDGNRRIIQIRPR